MRSSFSPSIFRFIKILPMLLGCLVISHRLHAEGSGLWKYINPQWLSQFRQAQRLPPLKSSDTTTNIQPVTQVAVQIPAIAPTFRQTFFVKARVSEINGIGLDSNIFARKWALEQCGQGDCHEIVQHVLTTPGFAIPGAPPGQTDSVFPGGYAHSCALCRESASNVLIPPPKQPYPDFCSSSCSLDQYYYGAKEGLPFKVVGLSPDNTDPSIPQLTAIFPIGFFQDSLKAVGGTMMLQNVLSTFHPGSENQAFIIAESSRTPLALVTTMALNDEWIRLKIETNYDSLENIPDILFTVLPNNIKPVDGSTQGRFNAELFLDDLGTWRSHTTSTFAGHDVLGRQIFVTIPTSWLTQTDGRLLTASLGGTGSGNYSGPVIPKVSVYYHGWNHVLPTSYFPANFSRTRTVVAAATNLQFRILETSTQDAIRISGEYTFSESNYSPDIFEFVVGTDFSSLNRIWEQNED